MFLQAWPLTPAWGALAGYIVGSLLALSITNLKEIVELGALAKREDEQAQQATPKKQAKKKTA